MLFGGRAAIVQYNHIGALREYLYSDSSDPIIQVLRFRVYSAAGVRFPPRPGTCASPMWSSKGLRV